MASFKPCCIQKSQNCFGLSECNRVKGTEFSIISRSSILMMIGYCTSKNFFYKEALGSNLILPPVSSGANCSLLLPTVTFEPWATVEIVCISFAFLLMDETLLYCLNNVKVYVNLSRILLRRKTSYCSCARPAQCF